MINPFPTNVPLVYPVKTSENLRFSDFFKGYTNETSVENGLIIWFLFLEIKQYQVTCEGAGACMSNVSSYRDGNMWEVGGGRIFECLSMIRSLFNKW